MDPVLLPAVPGAEGHPVVDLGGVGVCSAHGAPVVRRVRMAMRWMPVYAGERRLNRFVVVGSPMGNVARALRRQAESVVVDARGWPLCARCAATRRAWVVAAAALLGLGVVALVGAVLTAVIGGSRLWLLAPFLGGALLVVAAVVPFAAGSLLRTTRAHGTQDASGVLVHSPHPAFLAAVRD